MSYREASRRAGPSERRYGNCVSGRREPDLATLVRIASVLATTPNELLSEATEQSSATQLIRERIIAATMTLGKTDLERVAVMVEALAKHRGS